MILCYQREIQDIEWRDRNTILEIYFLSTVIHMFVYIIVSVYAALLGYRWRQIAL